MWQTIRQYLEYTSWPIIGAMIGLMGVGVMAINVSGEADPRLQGAALKQMIYCGVGLAAFLAVTFVPYAKIGRLAYPLFALTLLLLVAVFFQPATRGAHRWFDLGIIKAQPSELAKLSFIVLLAWYLRHGDRYRRLGGLIAPFALTFVPMGLILMEPDLGTSLLLLPTLYFMLFMAGAKLKHLLGIVAIGTAVVMMPVLRVESSEQVGQWPHRDTLSYLTIDRADGGRYVVMAASLVAMERHPHQIGRIEGWIRQGDPEVIMDEGYHLHQSKLVLGSGKLTGRTGWSDADLYFRMLPDDHTDFIFSVIGGQWGFLGCATVLVLYGVIFLFGIEIAVVTPDPFGRLLAVGVLGLLLSQIFINVGMTMGLMPITGMTLPFVSYGGSSLVANFMIVGLILNVAARRPIIMANPAFEFDSPKGQPVQRNPYPGVI